MMKDLSYLRNMVNTKVIYQLNMSWSAGSPNALETTRFWYFFSGALFVSFGGWFRFFFSSLLFLRVECYSYLFTERDDYLS